jgi:hypothetical protein
MSKESDVTMVSLRFEGVGYVLMRQVESVRASESGRGLSRQAAIVPVIPPQLFKPSTSGVFRGRRIHTVSKVFFRMRGVRTRDPRLFTPRDPRTTSNGAT